MENITNPILETPIITQPELVLPPPKKNYLTIVLISLVFVLFITCIYLLFRQSPVVTPDYALQSPTKVPVAVLPKTTAIPTNTVIDTTNWKTYKHSNGYQINYPQDWSIETTIEGFTLGQSGNKIKFDFPTGFGPGVCIFSDDPNFNNSSLSEMMDGSKCPGKFIEIKSNNMTLRRKDVPDAFSGDSGLDQWSIYTKGKDGFFSTDPLIVYIVPINSDKKIILLMDQILSTFKFTESKAASLGNWTKQTDNHFKTNNNCLWILTAKESYSGNLSSFVSKFYGNTPIEKLLDPTQYQVRDTQTITTSAQGVGELFTIFFDKNNSKHAITFSVTSQDDVLSKPQCKNYLTDVDYILNNIDFFI